MKYFLSALAASLLITVSAPGVASTSVPGLAESAIAVLEAHNEDIDDIEGQRAARERLEELSLALKKWWWDKRTTNRSQFPTS